MVMTTVMTATKNKIFTVTVQAKKEKMKEMMIMVIPMLIAEMATTNIAADSISAIATVKKQFYFVIC